MPTLPAQFPFIPAGGDLPVNSQTDVNNVIPSFLKEEDPAPVRDAAFGALTAILLDYQNKSGYAAAQSDVLRAVDEYLEGLANDRGVFKQPGEGNEALRARIFQTQSAVTPQNILGAINAILSTATTINARYLESTPDRLFIYDGTLGPPPAPHSFIGLAPEYSDRLYEDDATLNGTFVPLRNPGGSWIFNDDNGRYFIIRIPSLSATNDIHDFVYNSFKDIGNHANLVFQTSPGIGSFISNGSNTSGSEADGSVATFTFFDTTIAQNIYQSIVNIVENIKGNSIRWMLLVDPTLTS